MEKLPVEQDFLFRDSRLRQRGFRQSTTPKVILDLDLWNLIRLRPLAAADKADSSRATAMALGRGVGLNISF